MDPPDRRQVRDGVNLLHELGALDRRQRGRRLTPLGRRLAQLPLDPRFARMVLESDRLGCADEVIVIAAALSIQDPRERPAERARAGRPAARALQGRDVGLPRLPEPVALPARAAARAVGQPVPQALPGGVPALPAHPRVAGPRRRSCAQAAKDVGVTINRDARRARRDPRRAARPGCSRTSGCATPQRREYQGARGARFAIFPGSALAAAASRPG